LLRIEEHIWIGGTSGRWCRTAGLVEGRYSGPFAAGYHLRDDLNEDGALITALQPELTAQVTKLSQCTTTNPEQTAAEAKVNLAPARTEVETACADTAGADGTESQTGRPQALGGKAAAEGAERPQSAAQSAERP
jgi:hypothetical protein